MQPINLPVTPPRTVETVIPVPEMTAPAGRSFLRSGELFEALVLRNHSDGKVTVQIKNTSITAETRVALNAGEKITLRVEQMSPNIILRMAGETEIQKMGTLLRLHRSHSGALAELFSGAKDILDPALIEAHAGQAAAKTAMALLKGLEAAVFSMKTAENPLFVKDMMLWVGLLLERNLLKGQEKQDRMATIKELLVKLASAIRESDSADRLYSILAFLEDGVKAVEAQQIALVLGQELDQSLVLQAACQFPMGIRMQDIFIEQDAEGPDGQKRFHAILLLSMDALGEVIADASACGNRLDCVLYGETPEACDFLTAMLPELWDRLRAAVYTEPSVRCLLERNMKEAKSDRLSEKKLFSLHAVDIQT
jgi:hypothetical protein